MLATMTVLLIVITAAAGLGWIYFRSKRRKPDNLVVLKGRRHKHKAGRSPEGTQSCSRCKKKTTVSFYAGSTGTVKGLCKACRQTLEQHEELFPL